MLHPPVKGRQYYNSQNSSNGSLRHAANRSPSQVGAIVVKEESRDDG